MLISYRIFFQYLIYYDYYNSIYNISESGTAIQSEFIKSIYTHTYGSLNSNILKREKKIFRKI